MFNLVKFNLTNINFLTNNICPKCYVIINKMVPTVSSLSQRKYINYSKEKTESNIKLNHNDKDAFGTLDGSKKFQRLSAEFLPDDDDGFDMIEMKKGKKISFEAYLRIFMELINRRPCRVAEALKLFEQMKAEDRVPPDSRIYSLLIVGCSRVGYTKRAFELFEEELRRDLSVTKAQITALFNACAECPYPSFGIEKANWLRDKIFEKGYQCNTIHYHSMIKAYGKLGDLPTAFKIAEEMVDNGFTLNEETYSMLLIGCVSDKESGLYNAIRVIREMKKSKVPLTIYIYNLLLRTIRDCKLGSSSNIDLLLKEWNNFSPKQQINSSKSNSTLLKTVDNSNENISLPNLLVPNSNQQNEMIELDEQSLNLPSNRLMLLGGVNGLLELMKQDGVKPTINTFTLFLNLISKDSEDSLVAELVKNNIRPDIEFFNSLIKNICISKGADEAKKILPAMQSYGLEPDIFTYGVLALGCKTFKLGRQLLYDMNNAGLTPNINIIGSLVFKACKHTDFFYIAYLIKKMQKLEMKPNRKIIEQIEFVYNKFQERLSKLDRGLGEDLGLNEYHKSEYFRKGFVEFKIVYKKWIETVEIDFDDPWEQYQVEKVSKGKSEMKKFEEFMKFKLDQKHGDIEIDSEL